jgi:hypothetical protein
VGPTDAGPALDTSDLKEAYRMGRKDERAARKRHPVMMTITFLMALVGVTLLGLAAINGSFEDAGRVADHNLGVAADRAEPAVRSAADDAADRLRGADEAVDGTTTTPAERPG